MIYDNLGQKAKGTELRWWVNLQGKLPEIRPGSNQWPQQMGVSIRLRVGLEHSRLGGSRWTGTTPIDDHEGPDKTLNSAKDRHSPIWKTTSKSLRMLHSLTLKHDSIGSNLVTFLSNFRTFNRIFHRRKKGVKCRAEKRRLLPLIFIQTVAAKWTITFPFLYYPPLLHEDKKGEKAITVCIFISVLRCLKRRSKMGALSSLWPYTPSQGSIFS